METPSSTRITKSQPDSDLSLSKSRQRNGKQEDRSVLIDITNDSPIVGLASGDLETPLSSIAKQRVSRVNNTPGAGEALLRCQVKSLLQKVEKEAELSKLSLDSRPFLQLMDCPMGLLAPTPANTPQIVSLSGDGCVNNSDSLASVTPSPIVEEQLIPQVMRLIIDGKSQENPESEKSLITRSLLIDFSDKSEISYASECSSELTYQEVEQEGSGSKEKPSTEDDVSSIWSIQGNASIHDEDEEEIANLEEDYEDIDEEDYEYIEEEEELELVVELCKGLNDISANKRVDPELGGKHTRFIYNTDDELLVEEVRFAKHAAAFEGLANQKESTTTTKGKGSCLS